MKKFITIFIALLLSFVLFSCKDDNNNVKQNFIPVKSNAKITFVELGSVKCVPCRQMQPIMKSVEEKYGGQVNVIFYDVWTDAGHKYAELYKIDLIPTQVFLDKNNKEIFRHVGFFPEAEIDKFLHEQGLKILN